jgi:hypothetical protein
VNGGTWAREIEQLNHDRHELAQETSVNRIASIKEDGKWARGFTI